jgi:large subunit ribosomal protein L31
MKSKIHPIYYDDAKVTCACGASFVTGSVLKEIKVEVCSNCHPFYTGQMKYVDTMGRVEKFQKKQAYAKAVQTKLAERQATKKAERKKIENAPKSLREMLLGK